jgi:hypothetical protein
MSTTELLSFLHCPALQDFLAVLGGYFQAVQATMQSFLLHQVAPFQGISSKELARLCSHMLVSTFKAGKTWQLAAEEQVYFVKVGQPRGDKHHTL